MTKSANDRRAGGSSSGRGRDGGLQLQMVATLMKNRDGTAKKQPRVYEPKNGKLSVPPGSQLHGRPVILIGDGEQAEVKVIVWDDGLEFRFPDGTSQRKTFHEIYIDARDEDIS